MLKPSLWVSIVVFMGVLGGSAGVSDAAERFVQVSSRGEFVQALATATPGTQILVAPGDYAGGISQPGLRGTADQPIVVSAADPQRPPVIAGGASGLQLASAEHVELRHLVFQGARGNGLNIDDGGTAATPSRHVRLYDLRIREVGPVGNRDGIKLSGVEDFRVEACVIEDWGSAGSAIDMVGCQRGNVVGCRFRSAKVGGANGVQCKGGSRDISVRGCVFEGIDGRGVNVGGSTGMRFFRPRPLGYEAKDILVEDCQFIDTVAPIAFVGVDGATVRYNTIFRPRRWCIRILQETQRDGFVPSRKGRFVHNLIVFDSHDLRSVVNVGVGTAPETFDFAENLWYCSDRPELTRQLVRPPAEETRGSYDIDPGLVIGEDGNLQVTRPTGLEVGARLAAVPSGSWNSGHD